ncbi:UNVERIFIED_CONTAM: hypothetical protein GTU68_023240 [Idotea baltica]|nr:hypothetical protein [Idotea baltica]
MLEVLQVELNYASGRVFRNLRGIETIVAIAPLLGILGTVLGIIKSFSALDLGRLSNPAAVGAGLAEALITTAAGLIVAVPSLVIYNLLRSIGERHLSKIEASAEELFLLTARNRREIKNSNSLEGVTSISANE